ncbi:MAG TPA: NAD(P)/FAD-dependent oxidoreductase [Acidimicrobiia bacterium]|nr:NAD(P)/FAD-dependent oxidoreductase [Acidimicrobiia bacterium]
MTAPADVLVIGAGMAGVTAARECARAGLDVIVVEAQDRVGGRVHTARDFCEHPVEQGAEFIHTAEADTWPEVRAAGFETTRCNPADGYLMSIGGVRSPELWSDPSLARLGDMLTEVEQWDGPDVTAAELMAGKELEGVARAMADQMLTIHPLGDADQLGLHGLRDDRVVDLERGCDWRVAAGYDALPRHIAEGLDVRLGWEVRAARWSADAVTVTSVAGEELTARAAVCTLPVGVLKSLAVQFEPDLPASKWRALNGLEMGPVLKILYRFDEAFWPEDLTMLGCDGPVRLYWTPLYGRDDAPAVLTAYVSGHRARALSAMTEANAAAVGLADLDRLFPDARPSRGVQEYRRIDWCTNRFTRGGYSFVRVGGAGSRAALAAPDTGALFWAGDATSTTTIAAVVHAAYASGRRAAAEVTAHLG